MLPPPTGTAPHWAEPRGIRFTTGDLPAIASLTTVDRLGTFSAYTDTVVYATYRNVSSLQLGLYRLSPRAFMDLNTRWEAWDQFVPERGRPGAPLVPQGPGAPQRGPPGAPAAGR